jgi:hypothetical protein
LRAQLLVALVGRQLELLGKPRNQKGTMNKFHWLRICRRRTTMEVLQ